MAKKRHKDPQPRDLNTAERLGTTGRAVVQGVTHQLRGEHETQPGARETVSEQEVERIIAKWPEPQRNVARQMLDKYGSPNEATPSKLFWYANGPWKRTDLSSDVVAHHWPTVHTDFLTQTIDYRVPAELTHLVAMFDGSILVDRTRGEVAARCDSEAANVLGLNMVHEIVTGKRSVNDARTEYARQIKAMMNKQPAPLTERLMFQPMTGRSADPDQPAGM